MAFRHDSKEFMLTAIPQGGGDVEELPREILVHA
jgi:hypothetical protein